MMNDANIPDSNFGKEKLDILFMKKNRHRPNMKFETFLSLITDVAMEKFRSILCA